MIKIENDYDATVLALRLALTAPTDEQADECAKMASEFGLSDSEMRRAKVDAVIAAGSDLVMWGE
jgi:hypothetical protein|tara:strand:- start:751 stop:945 length:195 start_codon:yes stop_codon:yes gene_type:complete